MKEYQSNISAGCYDSEGREIEDVNELKELLPVKPFCSRGDGRGDLSRYGLRILPRELALKKAYIQLNPPHMQIFMTFDLDYSTWVYISEDVNLPLPLWCVGNEKNGHAHLIYGLANPVFTTDKAREKPQWILKAIYNAYREKLGADSSYSQLISKNPFAGECWQVFNLCNMLYTLEYLASFVELPRIPVNKISEDRGSLGRNCAIFEHVRVWSYKAVRAYWGKTFEAWLDAVFVKCMSENIDFQTPLSQKEVYNIAKSIAAFTWRKITPENFREMQRRSVNIRWSRESQKENGITLMKEGWTVDELREALGVSRATVFNWKKGAGIKRENLTELKAWEREGISRATWYRRRTE
ncbi:MAG: replication initiation protein [Synergistales bacterium]|nr:replication initiation protein [Synergistales bacterium]